jgi:glycosyltransferase involved in cell wall biosynthesis
MRRQRLPTLLTIDSLRMGGAETMLVNLANNLSNAMFEKIVVSLSRINPLADRIRPDAAQVVIYPRHTIFDLNPVYLIRELIRDRRIARILCFDFFDYSFIRCALVGLVKPKPQVFISVHQTTPEDIRDFAKIFAYTRLLTNDIQLITVCRDQADTLVRTYHLPREQFMTIYNGVDTDYFDPANIGESRDECRRRLGIGTDAFVILHVANFGRVKRHEDALRALAVLRKAYDIAPTIVFVGCGDPGREKELHDLTHNLGLTGSVFFFGQHSDVRPFYKMADCFTLSSSSESFSMAALEAMAMGLPCVLTDVGGARELMRDGIGGAVVRSKDPVALAQGWRGIFQAQDTMRHERIRQHIVDNFSLKQCVERYENVLGAKDG